MIKDLWNYFLGNAKIVEAEFPAFEEHPPAKEKEEVTETKIPEVMKEEKTLSIEDMIGFVIEDFDDKEIGVVFRNIFNCPKEWTADYKENFYKHNKTGVYFLFDDRYDMVYHIYNSDRRRFDLSGDDRKRAGSVMKFLRAEWDAYTKKQMVQSMKPRIRVKCETRKI